MARGAARPLQSHGVRARGRAAPSRPDASAMANIFATLFAVALCLVNAVVWTFISELPLMGICWVGGAGLCLFLHKWAKG